MLRHALLASFILGLLIISMGCGVKYAKPKSELPKLSADILDAWVEVELMKVRRYDLTPISPLRARRGDAANLGLANIDIGERSIAYEIIRSLKR